MEPKPMLFCDTKTVLSYMEPNFRFNLALKIPSIRKAEKTASLIINRLELQDNRFVVNETEYKMKVYRQCQAKTNSFSFPIGDPFPFGDSQNKNNLFVTAIGLSLGEVNYDFDEYGFKISPDESIQPGDITLDESVNQRRVPKLDELKYMCPEKSSLPCNHFIRLYVSGSMLEFPYTNMKMYQLMKGLLTTFFGNRIGELTVKNMTFISNVLWLWPVNGRKPNVQNVYIGEYSQLKLSSVQSLIDSSIPLTSLKMSVSHSRIGNHPLLQSVQNLIISNFSFLSDLFSIQTHKVSIQYPIQDSYIGNLVNLWMEGTRPIGVYYSFLTGYKLDLGTISHPEVLERSTDCIKLAMGSETIVVFQYIEADSKNWLTIETFPKKK